MLVISVQRKLIGSRVEWVNYLIYCCSPRAANPVGGIGYIGSEARDFLGKWTVADFGEGRGGEAGEGEPRLPLYLTGVPLSK